MSRRLSRSTWQAAAALAAIALLASCSQEQAAPGDISNPDAQPAESQSPGRSCRLSPDRYPTLLQVSADATPGDGIHFTTIGSAVEAARSGRLARGETERAACRITINVEPGTYQGSATAPVSGSVDPWPIIIDVPELTLHGALEVKRDRWGRATGDISGSESSVLSPVEPLPVLNGVTIPVFVVNAHPGGSAGNGTVIEGFDFRSGHDPAVNAGGQGVLVLRATGVIVRGNLFGGGFTESVDVRSGGAIVAQNVLGGGAGTCDICLAGPGLFSAYGNHLSAGGIPGIVVAGMVNLPVPAGVEPLELVAQAETWADVRNNEVRDHRRLPVGTGIRVDALGVGAPNVENRIHAIIQGNKLVNNRFGMIVHAAFPVANTNLLGNVDVTLGGNDITESCQAPLLVSFSRHTTTLGTTNNPYLRNSTFKFRLLGNVKWSDVWYGHPADLGNTLIVDGKAIANGTVQAYDPAGCPMGATANGLP